MVFAVLASSLALISIFAPVIYMDGIIGKFFESFAVVVTVGIIVSLLVSLTLTPMLCSRYLNKQDAKKNFFKFLNSFFEKLEKNYKYALQYVLKHRLKNLTHYITNCFNIWILFLKQPRKNLFQRLTRVVSP